MNVFHSEECLKESEGFHMDDLKFKVAAICIISFPVMLIMLLAHKPFLMISWSLTNVLGIGAMLMLLLVVNILSITYDSIPLFYVPEITKMLIPSLLHVKIIGTYILNYLCFYYLVLILYPRRVDMMGSSFETTLIIVWRYLHNQHNRNSNAAL